MKMCACLLIAAVALAGCEGSDVVGVDAAGRGRPSKRPEEATMLPMCPSLYRVGGTHDPASPNYNPGVADTALMHVPHTFAWSGRDPYGLCDPLLYRYRVDEGEFSDWAPDTTGIVDGLSDGGHQLIAQPGCPAVHGIEESFGFIVNFDPDSKIVEPPDASGTLTVPDGDTLWVRVIAHDREELEGVGGGIAQIEIVMDNIDVLTFVPPDAAEWWWSSNADPGSGHYIESHNSPQGGNAAHLIEARAQDVDGRWEALNSEAAFMFWYNFPPTVAITYPSDGDTLGSDFTIQWVGTDPDGDVVQFQYVLDSWLSAYELTEASEMLYEDIEPGAHVFRVRSQDQSGCWGTSWEIVTFYVE
ncbi:hypothetical protein KAW64_07675 [bacterium]|nr:hypothetical protein [bacterium]